MYFRTMSYQILIYEQQIVSCKNLTGWLNSLQQKKTQENKTSVLNNTLSSFLVYRTFSVMRFEPIPYRPCNWHLNSHETHKLSLYIRPFFAVMGITLYSMEINIYKLIWFERNSKALILNYIKSFFCVQIYG